MKENLRMYYRKNESYTRYLMGNKKRVSEIKSLYKLNRPYFGKRVLDLACGGGILGFILESKGHSYVGVDINLDMLKGARDYAKKINSKNKFIRVDVKKKKIKGKFDTITFIGNSLGHFTTNEFVQILENIPKAKYFILDYRDAVDLFFKKQWKGKMIERNKSKVLVSVTKGFNSEKGYIEKISHEKGKKDKFYFIHTVWAPFILESLMKLKGWELVKRKEERTWQGWLDVYKKK